MNFTSKKGLRKLQNYCQEKRPWVKLILGSGIAYKGVALIFFRSAPRNAGTLQTQKKLTECKGFLPKRRESLVYALCDGGRMGAILKVIVVNFKTNPQIQLCVGNHSCIIEISEVVCYIEGVQDRCY